MTKIVLQDIASLTNETAALAAINSNNALIETASDNLLSRDGTSPNQMNADLDMNGNQILNLPAPATATEPLRLQDLTSFLGGSLVLPNLLALTSGIQTSGAPPISTTFQGDGAPGNVWFNISSTPNQTNKSEWIAQFYQTSAVGSANPLKSKGALYAHTIANNGSGNAFGANFIGQASSGLQTGCYVTSLEVDQNNNNSNRPSGSFEYGSDVVNGQYYGITLGHGGTFKSSAAIYITDLTGGGNWQRAIAIGASAGSRAVIEDQSSATFGWLMTGTKTTALDFGGATLTNSIILPNNAPVFQKNSTGTVKQLFNYTASNSLNIGEATSNTFIVAPTFAPAANGGTALGGGTNAFSNLFLSAGATVNFNNGDVSLTHSTNTLALTSTVSGGTVLLSLLNNSNTANSHTRIDILNAGASAGNVLINFGLTGETSWQIGVNNADNGFYITNNASVGFGTSDRFIINSTGQPIWLSTNTTPATLGTNSSVTMTLTSNTNLRFSARGTDGATRVANLTLA